MLKALIEKGCVKLENFTRSGNKLGYLYLLTPKGVEEKVSLTRSFLARKHAEFNALQAEIKALEAELTREKEVSSGAGLSGVNSVMVRHVVVKK